MRLALTAAAIVLALAATAHADRVVAVTPLSVLGTEDTSPETKKLTSDLEAALAAQPGTKVIGAAQVIDAVKKAKRAGLKACEGDQACLADLGKLVGAQIVIAGEIGGLGASKVVYLGATDVATGKELRSTTLTIGPTDDGGGASGAAVRLLDPDKYVGQLHLAIDIAGATAYVNGRKVGVSPLATLSLPVGTHAIRVNHPEFHDFVRFVDIGYGKTTEVPVPLQQYPIVEHDVHAAPTHGPIVLVEPPLYRRWYVVLGVAVVTAVVGGIILGEVVHYDHEIHAQQCRQVDNPDANTCN